MRRSVLSCGELWSVTAVACKQPSQTRAPLSPIGTGYALPPAAPRRSATTAYQSKARAQKSPERQGRPGEIHQGNQVVQVGRRGAGEGVLRVDR